MHQFIIKISWHAKIFWPLMEHLPKWRLHLSCSLSLHTKPWQIRPQTYDGYSALHTLCIWLGIPERRMWILPHFKIPHSNTWIWCWSLKCRVLINRHKFRAWTQNLWWILRTLHSGFTLHTQDSPIQIHWVLSVECWVSVISLGPVGFGLFHAESYDHIRSTLSKLLWLVI